MPRGLIATTVVAAVLAGACAARAEVRDSPPAPRPPGDVEALAEIFDPALEPLGVRLVRAGIAVRRPGVYMHSPTGNHLALYVEPTGDYTTDDYVEGMVTITEVFAPLVFERWSALESFDVCQEPRPEEDDSEEPPPVTQVTMSREGSASIDWERFDLAALLALNAAPAADPADFTTRPVSILATPAITEHPAYRAAERAAAGEEAA